MVGARVRRSQVAFATARGLSVRRACALLSVARSALGYQSRLELKDRPVLVAMRELAARFQRFGYRRIQIYLDRQGHCMSFDRTHRLWRLAGLQVPAAAAAPANCHTPPAAVAGNGRRPCVGI
jgi:putative transposase